MRAWCIPMDLQPSCLNQPCAAPKPGEWTSYPLSAFCTSVKNNIATVHFTVQSNNAVLGGWIQRCAGALWMPDRTIGLPFQCSTWQPEAASASMHQGPAKSVLCVHGLDAISQRKGAALLSCSAFSASTGNNSVFHALLNLP